MTAACNRGGNLLGKEYVYVAVPQANLRDRLSAVYTKVGTVKNGDRIEVLEKSRRFYRVRADGVGEGWIEERYVVDQNVYDSFIALEKQDANTPFQSRAVTRAELNVHLTPTRDSEHLYQLKEGAKVDVLKRAVTDKNAKLIQSYQQEVQRLQQKIQAAQATAAQSDAAGGQEAPATVNDGTVRNPGTAKTPAPPVKVASAKPFDIAAAEQRLAKMTNPPPSLPEDWYLVRDSQKHVGWVLARMLDIDVPLEVAQYAEGQRIVAALVINTVTDVGDDGQTRQVPQYLVLTTEPKDGQPFDYNHLRVFSWNRARHRYETAYREHDLLGVFPVSVGHAVFEKEGDLPTFTIHVKDDKGQTIQKVYKMNGPIVRRVLSPAEEAAQKQALEQKLAERKATRDAHLAKYRVEHPRHSRKRR